MSSEQQVLVEITSESLFKLRDLYKFKLPKHIIAYNFIVNMIKRFNEHPEHREVVKIYSINAKVENDATFISVMVRESIQINNKSVLTQENLFLSNDSYPKARRIDLILNN